MTTKIDAELIARTSLRLLNEVGLDGLTMRLVAKELGVQAAALYWHVKNKRQLLDLMAGIVFRDAQQTVALPAPDVPWQEWLTDWAARLRLTMLSYRDGARVFAGTDIDDPLLFQTTEISLRTLCDAGFTPRQAARSIPVVLHYTIGFTIEEQARTGVDYGADNPYQNGSIADRIDRDRYPLTARAWDNGDLFADNPEESFADGLRTVIAGIDAVVFGG